MNKIIEKIHRLSNAMLKELMASLIAVAIVTTGAIFLYAAFTGGNKTASWAPGGPPQAAPGMGNVAILWNWNGAAALTAMKDITRLVFNDVDEKGMFWIKNGQGESATDGGTKDGHSLIGWNGEPTGGNNKVNILANVSVGNNANPNVGAKNLHVSGDLTVEGKINGADKYYIKNSDAAIAEGTEFCCNKPDDVLIEGHWSSYVGEKNAWYVRTSNNCLKFFEGEKQEQSGTAQIFCLSS